MLMKISYLKVVLPVLLFIPFITSCNNAPGRSLYEEWEDVMDIGTPFRIDKDGHYTGITSISKENMIKTLAGYGWLCYDTWEINPDGRRQKESYWKERFGGSSTQYYFNADGTVREFFISDAFPNGGRFYKDETWEWKDYSDSLQRYSERIILGNNEDDYLQIIGWSRDVFCAIQYLGVRSLGEKVYGISLYRRMTNKELADYNKTYRNIEGVTKQ